MTHEAVERLDGQLTLLIRADQAAFAIMSALAWMGGGLLLLEREEGAQAVPLNAVPPHRFLGPSALLVWALLVLSFSARLYDPLLLLLPLAVLPALGVLTGLASSTAQLSASLLWLMGTPAISEGHDIILPGRVLRVDASCTGVTVLALCLAAALMLALATIGSVAVITAFLVDALRVTLLAFTDFTPGLLGLGRIRSFGFWHEGIGSHLCSFVAISIVCSVYVLFLKLICAVPDPRTRHER